MDEVTELLEDFKLVTRFEGDQIEHLYDECDRTSSRRVVKRYERWERVRLLGHGAFGTVWLEKCVAGKQVGSLRATKDIRSPNGRVDYAPELEALSKLSKTSSERWFCQSFGWYQKVNTISIVMEYFPLGDLQTYASQFEQPLREGDVQHVTLQVLEGLEYMHRKGIAHRDIKPNVSCAPIFRDLLLTRVEHPHPVVPSRRLVGQDQ
jgi:calcium/calmodulin-dependent protein kinase I